MLKTLEQWIFPNYCCCCQQYTDQGHDLCAACKVALPWVENRCFQCGLVLTSGLESVRCQTCQDKPPVFDRLCALFSYEPPVIQWITGLKFGQRLAYGRILGELLAEQIAYTWYKTGPLPQAVFPVPLHAQRLRHRGFNQVVELLLPQQHLSLVPVMLDVCQRVRATAPQVALNKERRKRNLQGIFEMIKPVTFEHVAIMDDVVTTGSTVAALSQALKSAGVDQIDVWTICRA